MSQPTVVRITSDPETVTGLIDWINSSPHWAVIYVSDRHSRAGGLVNVLLHVARRPTPDESSGGGH